MNNVICLYGSSKKKGNSYKNPLALVEGHLSCGWFDCSRSGSSLLLIAGSVDLMKRQLDLVNMLGAFRNSNDAFGHET
jgi:hypothetical protein